MYRIETGSPGSPCWNEGHAGFMAPRGTLCACGAQVWSCRPPGGVIPGSAVWGEHPRCPRPLGSPVPCVGAALEQKGAVEILDSLGPPPPSGYSGQTSGNQRDLSFPKPCSPRIWWGRCTEGTWLQSVVGVAQGPSPLPSMEGELCSPLLYYQPVSLG